MKTRFKWLLLALSVAFVVCAASLGGCSPTIATWADRGEIGCDNEVTAADAWRDLALGGVELQQRAMIAAVFQDIEAVSGGKIFENGLDGKAIAMDKTWLDEAHAALEATLAGLATRRAAIDEMHARHLANIALTRESFAQIRRLNSAWASIGVFSRSELPAQVSALIAELRRARAVGPPLNAVGAN